MPTSEGGEAKALHLLRETRKRSGGLAFGLTWVVATTIGFAVSMLVEIFAAYVVGLPVALAVTSIMGEAGWQAFNHVRFGVAGAFGGATVGIAQWLSIRRLIPRGRWWILATAFAFGLIGGFVGGLWTVTMPSGLLLAALEIPWFPSRLVSQVGLVMAVVGAAQWLVFRKASPRAYWWGPMNALASGVAFGLYDGFPALKQSEALGIGVFWVVIAGITGAAVVWILNGNQAKGR